MRSGHGTANSFPITATRCCNAASQELGEAKASDLMISRSERVVIPGSGRVPIVQAIFFVCGVCVRVFACFKYNGSRRRCRSS